MSTESERIYPYWVGIVIDAIERNKSLTHNELGEAIYDAFAQVILKVENDAADLITRREQEAEARGRKEAEGQIALSVKKFKKLAAAVFAVDFYLNKPYPDDDRWTPYTRFVGPAMEALKAALFKNEDVGELEGIHRVAALTHPTPADSLNLSKSKGLKPAGDGVAEKPKTEHYLSQNGNSPIECICGKSFTAFDDAKMHIDQVVIGIYADGLTGLFGADTPTKTENEK